MLVIRRFYFAFKVHNFDFLSAETLQIFATRFFINVESRHELRNCESILLSTFLVELNKNKHA